jgi:flagellar hook-associated protein 2
MVGAISSPGIGSGLDVQSIVSQLVAVEKASISTLEKKATSFQTKLSVYGTIKSQFATLGDAATKLSTSSGWNSVTATSSNASAISVSASSGAAVTSFSMQVQQLAKAQSGSSSAVPIGTAMGTGTMTIDLGSWSGSNFTQGSGTPVSVTIDAGNDSLSAIAGKINDAGAGVTATVLKDASGERLLLRSKETGEANGFRISVADDDGNNTDGSGLSRLAFDLGNTSGMAQNQAGQNALATVNGLSISSASNKLTDTLPDMTINLLQVTTDAVELDVSADTDTIKKNVQSFIDAYNTLASNLKSATRYDESTQKAGVLQGDATAVRLQSALRSMMGSTTASSPFTRLSEVGIEIQTGGTLSLNSSKFTEALDDLPGLQALFSQDTGNDATQGFGLKVSKFATAMTEYEGLLSNKTDGIQALIDRNSDDQDRITERASRVESRLLAQNQAMDTKVSSLSTLNSFISQQIALWNNS